LFRFDAYSDDVDRRELRRAAGLADVAPKVLGRLALLIRPSQLPNRRLEQSAELSAPSSAPGRLRRSHRGECNRHV